MLHSGQEGDIVYWVLNQYSSELMCLAPRSLDLESDTLPLGPHTSPFEIYDSIETNKNLSYLNTSLP